MMIEFTVFDLATGAIRYSLTVPEEEQAANVPAGCGWIDGHWDGAEYYVDVLQSPPVAVPLGGGGAGEDDDSSNPRYTITIQTGVLAPGAVASGFADFGASDVVILRISGACGTRVRIFQSAAVRTADASRQPGTDPADGLGTIGDWAFDEAFDWPCDPKVDLSNMESPPSSLFPYLVENYSGVAQAISVTLSCKEW
jgi:hypothetical protein